MSGPPDAIARRRAALLRRLKRRYELAEETVRFGDISFPFTRVRDPDAVLDLVADEESRRVREGKSAGDLALPYWAALWDSAYGVGQWLTRVNAASVGGVADPASSPAGSATPPTDTPNMLDLGCGMGLAGVTALALGARVLFADIDAHALLFAQLNALPWARASRARRINWQSDDLAERFDLILGADILYERSQHAFIEAFLRRHLAPRGRAILGEPGRPTGDDFPAWARALGWTVTIHEETVITRPRPVRVFELTR